MKHGASLALVILLGCSSLTPDRISTLSQITTHAVALGAAQWLREHPEHRSAFNDVLAALIVLQRAGNTNENAYVERMASLPTDQFNGVEGDVYISPRSKKALAGDGGFVIWDAKLNKSTEVKGPLTMPVVKATIRGLRQALAPPPPSIGGEKVIGKIKAEGFREVPNKVLDAQFREILKGKTNAAKGAHEFPFLP